MTPTGFISLMEGTEDDFIARHKTGHISSDAYRRYEEPGGVAFMGTADKYPIVLATMKLDTKIDGLAGDHASGSTHREVSDRVRATRLALADVKPHISKAYPDWYRDVWWSFAGKEHHLRTHMNDIEKPDDLLDLMTTETMGFNVANLMHRAADDDAPSTVITFRKSGELNRYVKKDADDEIVRDANGDALMMSAEEIAEKGHQVIDAGVVAFDGPNPIGYASDEWGATGVYVERHYQRHGIGRMLLRLFRQQFKRDRQIGQMTNAGENLTRSYYREFGESIDADLTAIRALRGELARAAQEVLDAWTQDADGVDEELGCGGCCDQIADAMGGVLAGAGFDCEEGGQEGDDHAYLIVNSHIWVDIAAPVYETGSGYVWRKRPNIQLSAGDVIVEPL